MPEFCIILMVSSRKTQAKHYHTIPKIQDNYLRQFGNQILFDHTSKLTICKAFVNHRVSLLSQFSTLTYLTPPHRSIFIDIQDNVSYTSPTQKGGSNTELLIQGISCACVVYKALKKRGIIGIKCFSCHRTIQLDYGFNCVL